MRHTAVSYLRGRMMKWGFFAPLWFALGCGGDADGPKFAADGAPIPSGGGEVAEEAAQLGVPAPKLLACVEAAWSGEAAWVDGQPSRLTVRGTIEEIGRGLAGSPSDGTCPFVNGYR